MRDFVVAITGASGAVYGKRLLEAMHDMPDVRAHLVVSPAGWRTVTHELGMSVDELSSLADIVHDASDVGASIASGSFRCQGMVVAPCSMRTLAAVAHGISDSLITRAADVMLKERRRLVMMVRETPLHLGHIRNMATVTEMGAIVCPPMPAFYLKPRSLNDIVDQAVARVLDLLDVQHELAPRWTGGLAAAA
ncbi:UbiX family flavin prenyltransferase [Ramlibacter sp. GTP1]|uniref:Flavin prenyltransferase UbiX n=1 Tax=Ramlibacter albus TaxID=2079448 RepID=A0A923S5J9_9BURK|nr:UbiX family flavin prenyltransferase [Ramlibacter albus]